MSPLKQIKQIVIATAFALTPLIAMPPCLSGEPLSRQSKADNTSGTIDIELQSRKKDPYLTAQENALTYFRDLKNNLLSVKSTQKKLLLPDPQVMNYLSGLYLFCSIKRGTCPAIPEAILEIDIVNSKLSNTTLCPAMKSFWKKYLESDFEDRLKYSVSTGFVSKVNEYNSKERPKYLRCEDTLKELFKTGESAASLFPHT